MSEQAMEEDQQVTKHTLIVFLIISLCIIQSYEDINAVKTPFDVAQCDGDSLYTYLPNWLNSLTDEQIRAPPMSGNVFQQYIGQSHLESSMANSIRKMALK